jgi:hypothetical protein
MENIMQVFILICICIVAYHIGTLDARRVDDVGAEPEDDVWLTYPEDGWMDPDVPDRRQVLVKGVSSN